MSDTSVDISNTETALARHKAPAVEGSVADLAGDIIGSVEGPGDLSTNKKHMDDYGR